MRMDGELTKQEFEELKNETEAKIKEIENDIELFKIKLDNIINIDQEIEYVKTVIDNLDHLDDMDVVSVNTFLKTIIKKIYVSSNSTRKSNSGRIEIEPTIEIEFINNSIGNA
jgi:hypothetical protein